MANLPVKNENGYYEIRMESIGGMGANIASQMLAEAAILGQGFNGTAFASYGSEKTGSPIKAFVRLADSDAEIRDLTPVQAPHLLIVFHEALAKSLPVMMGANDETVTLLNTTKTPEEAREFLGVSCGKVFTIDATEIARQVGVPANTTIIGAAFRASGFLEKEHFAERMKAVFGKKRPHLVGKNMEAFDRGFNEAAEKYFEDDGTCKPILFRRTKLGLGWRNAPAGGVITNPGNTVKKDVSGTRSGYIPVFHADKCIHCAMCSTTCPDYCIVWEPGEDGKMMNHGIDYRFCKGCLKCVDVCPKEALTTEIEKDFDLEKITVKKKVFHQYEK